MAQSVFLDLTDQGGPFTGQQLGPAADNTAAPPYSFVGDTDTGYASSAANTLDLVTGGTSRFKLTTSSLTLTVPVLLPDGAVGATAIGPATTPSTGMYFTGSGASSVINWAVNGTRVWQTDTTGMMYITRDAGGITLGASSDAILVRDAAAAWQLGANAAGVTNQMLKGPDRITSDGVGGNLTIAGGRGRGGAGGSVIIQTAPAAGAGVTGTLATALTIDSTKLATFVGQVVAASVRGAAVTVANLPATPVEGMLVAVTDSNTTTWGATIAGSSTNHVLAYYNGSNWTVAGK